MERIVSLFALFSGLLTIGLAAEPMLLNPFFMPFGAALIILSATMLVTDVVVGFQERMMSRQFAGEQIVASWRLGQWAYADVYVVNGRRGLFVRIGRRRWYISRRAEGGFRVAADHSARLYRIM